MGLALVISLIGKNLYAFLLICNKRDISFHMFETFESIQLIVYRMLLDGSYDAQKKPWSLG